MADFAGRFRAPLVLLPLACAISACASAPAEPVTRYAVTPAAQAPQPVSVAALATFEQQPGPRLNQWGGEVPDAAPSSGVSDAGLAPPRSR